MRVVLKLHLVKKDCNAALDFSRYRHLPLWTAPVYVYPSSMHFGTFQPELIGDCLPLHSPYLSPALYRLTEVVLILLMLPTNRVRHLVRCCAMLLQ